MDLNQIRPTTQLIVHTAAQTLHRGQGILRCATSTPSRRRPPNTASETDPHDPDPATDVDHPANQQPMRVEDLGPMTLSTVRNWLLHQRITLRPVIDLNDHPPPVDSYEIPDQHRRHLALRHPASLFPWSTSQQGLDLDHVQPYLPSARGGTPGQTGLHNLAPLSRHEHRLFTHAGWQRRQPDPGTLLVRAPHGRIYLTNNAGTHDLGTSEFATAIWNAATPSPTSAPSPAALPARTVIHPPTNTPSAAEQRLARLLNTI